MKLLTLLLVLTVPSSLLMGFTPAAPCPTPEVIAGAGDLAIKWSAGCGVPLDLYCRTPESQERLAVRINAAEAKAKAAEEEAQRLRVELAVAQSALTTVAGVVESQECPPAPECSWLKPALTGVVIGAAGVSGAWLGVTLAR